MAHAFLIALGIVGALVALGYCVALAVYRRERRHDARLDAELEALRDGGQRAERFQRAIRGAFGDHVPEQVDWKDPAPFVDAYERLIHEVDLAQRYFGVRPDSHREADD